MNVKYQLYLVGGLFDGVYLPLHPCFDCPPTTVLIHSAETSKWYSYESDKGGGTADIDVYRVGPSMNVPTEPFQRAQIYEMKFDQIIPETEAKDRIKHGERKKP